MLAGVRAAGFDLAVACPAEGPLAEELREDEVPILPAQWRDEQGGRRPLDEFRDELLRIIRLYQPELVHANGLSIGRVAGPVVDELRLPSVAHLRDILKLRRAEIADLNRHRRLVAVSHATRDYHIRQGLTAERSVVVYNGVDLANFRPARPTGWMHRELGLAPSEPLVGVIGQIALRKGLDTLLAAARRIAETTSAMHRPTVHWVIVGECYSQKAESQALLRLLQQAAVEGPLAGRVHLVGQRDSIERLLPELALLVHPARQEPLGRVLLEGAACGTAIVTTDVGGTPEIFPGDEQDRGVVLVPPAAPGPLAVRIVDLLTNDEARRRLGQRARRAAERFTIDAAVSGLVEQYNLAMLD